MVALGQRKTKLRCESESRHLHLQTKRAYYSALDCRRWLGDNLVCNGTLRAYIGYSHTFRHVLAFLTFHSHGLLLAAVCSAESASVKTYNYK